MRTKKVQYWLVIPDMQIPTEDKKTMKAVEAFMADHRWDGCINLGDFLDFHELSSFDRASKKLKRDHAIQRSYDYGKKVLDRHLAALRKKNRKCRYVLIEGNHDYRIVRYLEENPEGAGMLEVPVGLGLAERKIEWIPSWSEGKIFRLGKASFIHGKFTNKYHANKTVSVYGCNIYYGHTHDVSEFSLVYKGKDETLVGKSLGCLCNAQAYMRGSPDNWQQAIAVFAVFPDGYYTEHTIRIFRHRFEFCGKVYDGNKL